MSLDPSQFIVPSNGMSSVEAAQQFLKEQDAKEYERTHTFDMDELEKAAIVRWLGFPFAMTVHRNRIIFTDRTTGLKTTCLFTEPMDLKTGKRMVRSLARLKKLHDDRK